MGLLNGIGVVEMEFSLSLWMQHSCSPPDDLGLIWLGNDTAML